MRHLVIVLGLLCLASPTPWADDRYESAPISYSAAKPVNAISRLQKAIDSGQTTLTYAPGEGYLGAVLKALDIPVESQTLVFSKTSFQQALISPERPRALYFNDDTYIGVVPGGEVLEVSTADPKLGAVYYTMPQTEAHRPQFVRRTQDCLQCHATSMTNDIPGHVIRSVYANAQGIPLLRLGTHMTTQDSPFSERWGGWYVTGKHGAARHMGNVFATDTDGIARLDREAGANRLALDERIDPAQYLTPHSDIVALLVLEHQTQMHNLITQASFAAQFALQDQAVVDQLTGGTPNSLSDSTKRRIASAGDRLLRYMLFVDEVELDGPVEGTSGFAQVFASRGPRDSQGRSLRDFDLKTRLFKFPLSYLIYSEQFDALPDPMREYLYRQLWDILNRRIDTPDYLHLTNAKCRAILDILRETKPGLPPYWKQAP